MKKKKFRIRINHISTFRYENHDSKLKLLPYINGTKDVEKKLEGRVEKVAYRNSTSSGSQRLNS